MTDTTERIVLDPTGGSGEVATRPRALRSAELTGKRIGLLDITKMRGDVFLDRLAEHLTTRGYGVERFAKPTFTKIAPIDLRHEISTKCDVVIEALAD